MIRRTNTTISKANHPVIPMHPTESAARWVQLLTALTSSLGYTETSSTLLTLELSISPDKVREISNLTKSSEKPQTYNQIGWVTASALCQLTKPPRWVFLLFPNRSTAVYSGNWSNLDNFISRWDRLLMQRTTRLGGRAEHDSDTALEMHSLGRPWIRLTSRDAKTPDAHGLFAHAYLCTASCRCTSTCTHRYCPITDTHSTYTFTFYVQQFL